MRRSLEFLGFLTDDDLHWLMAVGKVQELRAGETLVVAGQMLDAVFILIEGRLASGHDNAAGVLHSGPGEVVGEISAKPAPATVTAELSSRVLRVRRADLVARCEDDDGFAERFGHAVESLVSRRMRQAIAGEDDEPSADAEAANKGSVELDDDMLDQIGLAAKKFDWIRSSR